MIFQGTPPSRESQGHIKVIALFKQSCFGNHEDVDFFFEKVQNIFFTYISQLKKVFYVPCSVYFANFPPLFPINWKWELALIIKQAGFSPLLMWFELIFQCTLC